MLVGMLADTLQKFSWQAPHLYNTVLEIGLKRDLCLKRKGWPEQLQGTLQTETPQYRDSKSSLASPDQTKSSEAFPSCSKKSYKPMGWGSCLVIHSTNTLRSPYHMGHSKVLETDGSQDNQEEITQGTLHSNTPTLLSQDVGWKCQDEGRKKAGQRQKDSNNDSESDTFKLERAAV